MTDRKFRILSIDGGGSKAFYSLGALYELEGLLGSRLLDHFDYFIGTSAGALIATLLASGKTTKEIHQIFQKEIPYIMKPFNSTTRTQRLKTVLEDQFKSLTMEDIKTNLAIVTSSIDKERPVIFKSYAGAHSRSSTFVKGFGCKLSDILLGSCAATPFFKPHYFSSPDGVTNFELADGCFSSNNPSLYAICDAKHRDIFNKLDEDILLVSISTGSFAEPHPIQIFGWYAPLAWLVSKLPIGESLPMLSKTLTINSNSTDFLCNCVLTNINKVRIDGLPTRESICCSLIEHDPKVLERVFDMGRTAFSKLENDLKAYLITK